MRGGAPDDSGARGGADTPLIRARLADGGGIDLEPLEGGGDPAAFLEHARAEAGPTVFLLPNRAMAPFTAVVGLVVDRGTKNPSKPLSSLLLGYDEVPAIRGSYSSPGQLTRSLRTLLRNAQRMDDDNVFLVGADDDVFAEMWIRASGDELAPVRTSSASAGEAAAAETRAGEGERSLADLLPRRPVPIAVRRRFVGNSAEVELVRQLALRAAGHDEPVLCLGDTGTGKEVVARIIHDQSPRRRGTFVAVNCGAIPRELLESELFGAEPGAYTDLKGRKTGLWRTADGGTLFLDEIADLAVHHQVKILRSLEDGRIRPLGSEKSITVNVRIIAATNRDLFALVSSGEFRQDLYYRLRSFLIRTPPLRDRPEDIPTLAEFFWRRITRDAGRDLPREILRELATYRWPGNARELKMVLSNLFVLFGPEVRREHLHAIFEFEGQAHAGRAHTTPGVARPTPASPGKLPSHRVECLRHLREVDEALRAWEVVLEPALEADRPTENVEAAAAAGRRRLEELEILCLHPLLFGAEPTYATVERLKDSIAEFHRLLVPDPDEARRIWSLRLAGELALARRTLFAEAERLAGTTG